MLAVETFPLGPLGTNAYLLTKPGEARGIILDPGGTSDALAKRLEGLRLEAILLTHAHFDHIGGVEALREAHGCPVYLHAAEAEWMQDPEWNGSLLWPEVGGPIVCRPADRELADGQKLTLLDASFKVRHTPGHSPGSVSLVHEGSVFGGDVLFRMGVGRTDLPGGSTEELYRSIYDVLFQLPPDTVVYPGHGPATTIGEEQTHNPYV